MKKTLIFIVGIAVLMTGCANKNPLFTQTKQFADGQSGVKILAAVASILSSPEKKASAYQTPIQYSIAVSSIKLLKSLDDASPYVAYDSGSFANTADMNLKEGVSQAFGANSNYPSAGTYTHLAYTLLYVKQTCTYHNWPNAGANEIVYRAFASSYGAAQPLDVQVFYPGENVWKWDGNNGTMYETRPSTVYQVNWDLTIGWKMNNTFYVAQKDPTVIIVPLTSPVVVPSNPTGLYVGTMSFDITNKLEWNDRDGDGKLDTDDESTQVGQGSQVSPLPPEVTVTFIKQ